jgi:hypothetical protein
MSMSRRAHPNGMAIVNLTPHAIVLRGEDGEDHRVPPSGRVARVSAKPGRVLRVDWLPVPVQAAPVYGAVEDLPPPADGVVFLVSGLVLAQSAGRADVFGPGTGPSDGAVRDEGGRVVAVTRLIAAPSV